MSTERPLFAELHQMDGRTLRAVLTHRITPEYRSAVWAEINRRKAIGLVYDHEARPDDLPGPGHYCKDCGQDIIWIGPSQLYNWRHVADQKP
jgi:hypothetical protein